jgi:hypothetical protein
MLPPPIEAMACSCGRNPTVVAVLAIVSAQATGDGRRRVGLARIRPAAACCRVV